MPVPLSAHANKFNRGEVDPLALARDDIDKVVSSGSLMTNFMPLRLGPMVYRPGFEFIDQPGTVATYLAEFIASTTDTAIIEFSNALVRVRVDDDLITRTTVTSTILNGSFTTNLNDWTDADEAGSVSAHVVGGAVGLTGNGVSSAIRYQTIGATQTGVEHAIRLEVISGPILLQLGTAGASSDDLFTGILQPGTHSLVFTPGSALTITVSNSNKAQSLISAISFDTTGTFFLSSPVTTNSLPSVRYAQSADVMFIAYDSGEQFKLERRGVKSWSLVKYRPNDGPFGKINNTDITLTAGALAGTTPLTASKSYFKSTDLGVLFKLLSAGQQVLEPAITAQDTGTDSIRVTGIDASRRFIIVVNNLSGTGSTITLQQSTDDATWTDFQSYTTDQSKTFNDGLDNAILFYRLHCKTGDYSSGSIGLALTYEGGAIEGIARVVGFTSSTVVTINVLTPFGRTDATRDWYRGEWDDVKGFPTAVSLYEGRLWYAGRTKTWGSVSDDFESFDDTIEGDSAPIRKTIGFGPVDRVEWLLPLGRLSMGIASDVLSIRSNAFGVVLTPSNTNIKPGGGQGAAPRQPVKMINRGYYVQQSLNKIYELDYTVDQDGYEPLDLTVLNPDICKPGIKRIAVTTQPEKRLYVVMDDGTARVYLMDKTENVKAWSRIETDGTFQDVVVLPAVGEDRVYFMVTRTGGTYFEKLALFSEAVGGDVSKTFDSFKTFTSPGTTISGLDHLDGKTVGVWADGQYRQSAVVSSGSITVSSSWTNVVVGLRYTADWTSSKINRFVDQSVLTYRKRVVNTGFVLKDYWPGSLKVGPDSSNLGDFPDIEDGTTVPTTATQSEYDQEPFTFNGTMESDPRIHLQADNPVTVMALTYGVDESNDPTNQPG